MTLLLASASPRRAELLRAAGLEFEVLAADVDESPLARESADAHVRRLAENKARAVAALRPDAVVLAADTVVVVDGRILGKPRDGRDAARMLRVLSGRAHDVITGVALLPPGARLSPIVSVVSTRVWFSSLSDAEVAWYIGSGEPMDKAGAYAIQGLGSRFVERIEGSYSNVVGLPMAVVYQLLQSLPHAHRSRVR